MLGISSSINSKSNNSESLTYVFLENYWVLSIPGDIYTVPVPAEPEYEVKKAKKWPDRVAHLAQKGSPGVRSGLAPKFTFFFGFFHVLPK